MIVFGIYGGKVIMFRELDGTQQRQLIDTQQVFEAWRAADAEHARRFVGSMRWARRGEADYLLRKTGAREISLGRRSAETENAYDAFVRGRDQNADRLRALATRLDELAPVNRAMGLGRLPVIAARVLRRCDEAGLLGKQLFVVGTNALFAYEVLAGNFVGSDLVASRDVDLLYDARRGLGLAMHGIRQTGLIGLLRKVDESFAPLRPRSFRAANRDGYMVDLIRPEPKNVFRDRRAHSLTDLPDDLEGAAIFGLDWLINAPKLEAVPLDERGYPLRVVAIDPRFFALHKAWLSRRPDRDPLKVRRDFAQAKAAAQLAVVSLHLPFEETVLSAMPLELRRMLPDIVADRGVAGSPPTSPQW